MKNLKISVIIPIYNGEKYMREAIDSVINQTYKNIEIIIVDDGSVDKTEEIAKSYGKKIKYFYKTNGGVSSALNYGINKMTGEYFSWLSHDDVFRKDKIEKQVCFLEKNKLANKKVIINSQFSFIDEMSNQIRKPSKKYKKLYSDHELLNELLHGSSLYGCCLLIPKNLIDETGYFDIDYVYIQDHLYWIKMAYIGASMYTLPDKLVKVRRHKDQISVKKAAKFDIEIQKMKYALNEYIKNDVNKNYNILKKHLKYNYYWQNEFSYIFIEKIYRFINIKYNILIKSLKRIIINSLMNVGGK